jgi:hypothetical protein
MKKNYGFIISNNNQPHQGGIYQTVKHKLLWTQNLLNNLVRISFAIK